MKTQIDLGPYILTDTPHDNIKGARGRLFVTVEPITDTEFSTEQYPAMAPTIAQLQQQLGGLQG